VSATLTLLLTSSHDGVTIDVRRSLVEWYEGTWDNGAIPSGDASAWNYRHYNGSVPWVGGAGGSANNDYAGTATDCVVITGSGVGQTFSWDVTSDVQNFVDGVYTNHGWWLVLSAGTIHITFASSDAGTASDRPKLVVEYENPNAVSGSSSGTSTVA